MNISTEYVLAKIVQKPSRWSIEPAKVKYLEEYYHAEETENLDRAFKTESVVTAQERLKSLQKNGYARGFKVMRLTTGLVSVR